MTVLSRLSSFQIVAPDVETTGLHWYRDKMFGIAIAGYDGKDIVSEYIDIREKPRALEVLRRELPRCKKLVNHNMKFDAHFMLNEGIPVPLDKLECTSVRAALINEHEPSFSLDNLGEKYVGMRKVDIYAELAAMFGGQPTRAAQMKNLHRAPSSLAGKYAVTDPVIALKLWLWQEEEIKRQGLERVWDLERRLMPILIQIERAGVRVDVERAVKSSESIDTLVWTAQKALNKAAGRDVNVNSPKQMREILLPEKGEDGRWRVGGILLESTGTGAPSLDADALRSLSGTGHGIATAALRIRKLTKGKSFLKDHILGHEVNGIVYPNYNQTRGDNEMGTGTGRFSIDDPALQQIPSRDVEVAEIARSCFIPTNRGDDWLCLDWAQFEFRWFAHYVNNPKILQMYADDPGTDFHKMTAILTGLPRSPTYAGEPNAKQINLGLVFGMGKGKMAMEMGLEYTVEKMRFGRGDNSEEKEVLRPGARAQEIFEQYHSNIPGVQALLDKAGSIAKSRGYVQTAMGRHIRFPGGQFTHKAGGLVFQGTSADCMKQKMVEMYEPCKKEGIQMLLSVHDELDFSVPKESKRLLPDMEQWYTTFDGVACPIKCRVPIKVSSAFGPNWFEASK
jgi:DNA polymerase-1